jgi:MFS family permease
MAMAVALLSTFLLTVGLVKEPRGKRMTGRPHPGLLSAFHIETRRHRIFLRLVGSRFLFLLGTYGVGRFFLFYVEDRLGLGRAGAASQTGMLLGALALLTGLSSPPAGWAADRFGRLPLIRVGAFGSVVGVLGLVAAGSAAQLLLWGALMAVGSAAFAAGNWAFITDVVPPEEAGRFMGLANFGTAGAAAVAGLAGPLVDWGNGVSGGSGYIALFAVAACAFGASALALRGIDRTVSAGRMVEVAAG